jgi:uncharacterized protein YdaU (DUF1376 family)
MSGQAWYKHNPLDFLGGIVGMPPEQIGAYIVVINLIYARNGPIPNDARWLSGHMGCSPKMAKKLVESLAERGRIGISNGTIHDDRADAELAISVENSLKNSRNGKTGGEKRAEKERLAKENSGLDQAGLKPKREEENREEEEDDVVVGADASEREVLPEDSIATINGKIDLNRFAGVCARTGGVDLVQPGHIGAAVDLVKAWFALGADPDFILQTIREGVMAATEPISSLKYFNTRLRTAIAKRKALENGTPSTRQRRADVPEPDAFTAGAVGRMAARRAPDSTGDLELLG